MGTQFAGCVPTSNDPWPNRIIGSSIIDQRNPHNYFQSKCGCRLEGRLNGTSNESWTWRTLGELNIIVSVNVYEYTLDDIDPYSQYELRVVPHWLDFGKSVPGIPSSPSLPITPVSLYLGNQCLVGYLLKHCTRWKSCVDTCSLRYVVRHEPPDHTDGFVLHYVT